MNNKRQAGFSPRSDDADLIKEKFNGLKFDTCANQTFVISIGQYRTYNHTFNLPYTIRPPGYRTIKGIGGITKSVGQVTIQVPFKCLEVVNDVSFLVVTEDVPKLPSVKDMLANVLSISV